MKTDFEKARQRALRYGYEDGLLECAFGGLCLLLGLYFYAQATLQTESLLYKILDVSLVLIIIGGSFLVNRLVTIAKEHFTYPRTGYVAYRQATGIKRWVRSAIIAGVAMVISALLVYLFANQTLDLAWMPAVTGLVFGLGMFVAAFRISLARFYLLSVVAVAIGIGLTLSGIGNSLGLAAFYALFGLAIGLSGVLTLKNYLQQAPPPAEDADGR